ncbi:Uncharacterised protein [Streptococcus equi subsp. zooepidemicus]|nr:hypothetical protein GDAKBCAL_00699 [Streptococcus equi subsp. zooepidemicus]QUQ79751.1 hypothetical protein LJFMMFNO_00753 [Streptococcus equi subsp. zooepidemicus]SQF05251.1 Uncharacterised protein [Streptococcus equi subsp. zooepidemicus]
MMERKKLFFDCIISTIISFIMVFFLLEKFDLWKSIIFSIVFVFVATIIPYFIHKKKE